ncbi:MAG: Gfo/Idh/MocA family oxidoreductase, partial [Acidobacteria bacterium]|nr:Gfo/Idh/MocA family oxidoreductase [Acidobacteriota bacterium]
MITRREAARTAAVTALSYAKILGANDRIGLGVIGVGNRGTHVMGLFQKNPEVEVRAICDVYGVRIDKAQQKAPNAKGIPDHHRLLELKEVDAVLIAAPDHWHHDLASAA